MKKLITFICLNLSYRRQLANTNATPLQCYNKVNEIISQIRTAIANNSNTPVNQLIF